MGFLDDDVAAMTTDAAFSVAVVFDGRTTRGLLDKGTRIVTDTQTGESMQVEGTFLTYAESNAVLAGLANNDSLTVDGTAYRATLVDAEGDGKVKVVKLRRA